MYCIILCENQHWLPLSVCHTKTAHSVDFLQPQPDSKTEVHSRTSHEGPEESSYSSTLSLTSVFKGGGWSTPRPRRCTPRTYPVPIVWEDGWARGQSGRVRKISPPPSRIVRAVKTVVYIQGVTGGTDQTSGECSLGHTIPI